MYPNPEQWRINTSFLILFGSIISIFVLPQKYKKFIILFLLFIFPVIALFCNIIVVSGNSINYIRSGNLNLKLLTPYLVGSVPFSFFGASISVLDPTNSSLMSIGISLFIVVIASANLVIDFDFIEEGAEKGAPKYMEWYGAFGLLVTLIWLYLEILRLLAKLNSRK